MKLIKTIFSFLTLLLIVSSFSFGQAVSVGVTGGSNLSRLHFAEGMDEYDFYFWPGANVGVFGEVKDLYMDFSVHAEVLYSMRGGRFGNDRNFETNFPMHDVIQSLNYVDIPILVQYNFKPISNVTPRVFLGPVVSFLLNANSDIITDIADEVEEDIKEKVESNELGIMIGGGFNFEVPLGEFFVDLRYRLGLNDIKKNIPGVEKITSSNISLNIGYGISLN